MFNKLRNGGKPKSKSGIEPSLSGREHQPERSSQLSNRASKQAPRQADDITRAAPPRLELPRRRGTAPDGPALPPNQGSANKAPPNQAHLRPAHLKAVGPAAERYGAEPSGVRAAAAPPRPVDPRPISQPVSQPKSQAVSRPVAQPVASAPARPVIPPYPVAGARGAAAPAGSHAPGFPPAASPGAEVQSLGRLMLVGPQIRLTGEIKACERLVIEGAVEGEVSETERLEIARGGRFQGGAQVENCMVDGVFEGELDVRGVLTIRPNGLIQGTVRYGDIEIERGGRISGTFGARAGESQAAHPAKSSGPRQA